MPTIEQFVCWGVGLLLLVAAFRYLVKEKLTFSFVLCIGALAFFFFGLSGVQGLLKTGLLLTVKDSLVKYGERLESFQTNVAGMKAELSDQQAKLREAQHELACAQTNLALQQRKLENVESIVNGLYSRMVFEKIPFSDTNRIWKKEITNGVFLTFCRLKHPPVSQSIQASLLGDLFPYPLNCPVSHHKNILIEQVGGGWFQEMEGAFSVQYVIDSTETNLVQNVHFRGEDIFLMAHGFRGSQRRTQPFDNGSSPDPTSGGFPPVYSWSGYPVSLTLNTRSILPGALRNIMGFWLRGWRGPCRSQQRPYASSLSEFAGLLLKICK